MGDRKRSTYVVGGGSVAHCERRSVVLTLYSAAGQWLRGIEVAESHDAHQRDVIRVEEWRGNTYIDQILQTAEGPLISSSKFVTCDKTVQLKRAALCAA